MEIQAVSYDMKEIRDYVPIKSVIDALGLHHNGHKMRCWRPAHPDKHPSVGIDLKRNRVKCFKCDAKQQTNIDLVASVKGISTYEAANWIGDGFGLTQVRVGKKNASKVKPYRTKYWTASLYKTIPASARAVVERVMTPDWGKMSPGASKLYMTLNARLLAQVYNGTSLSITLCMPDLIADSGMPKRSIIRATQELEDNKLIRVIRPSRRQKDEGTCNSYSLTWLNTAWQDRLKVKVKKKA